MVGLRRRRIKGYRGRPGQRVAARPIGTARGPPCRRHGYDAHSETSGRCLGTDGRTEDTTEHTTFLHHYLAAAQVYLEQWGVLAVFLLVMVEGFGVPAPGQSMVIAGGLLAAQGKISVLVLPIAWAAAVTGDNIGYAIGHFGGRPLVLHLGRRIGIRSHHLERVEGFFQRWGGGVVIVARFFEGLRQLNGVIAGTSGMPWWRFLIFNAIGAGLWVSLWGLGAYLLGHHLEQVLEAFKRLEPWLIAAAVILFAAAIVFYVRRRSRSE